MKIDLWYEQGSWWADFNNSKLHALASGDSPHSVIRRLQAHVEEWFEMGGHLTCKFEVSDELKRFGGQL